MGPALAVERSLPQLMRAGAGAGAGREQEQTHEQEQTREQALLFRKRCCGSAVLAVGRALPRLPDDLPKVMVSEF